MNNYEILNPNEGKMVDNIVWPFYRYSALIPKQIGADLFVWLYLSLVIFQNQQKGLQKDNYTDEVQKEVEIIMLEKFSSVIDNQTFEKIRTNAEREFTDSNRLRKETFSFVDTYESLFSDKLDVKYVYQDAITGEVVPFFGDTSHIDDSDSHDNILATRSGIKEPSKAAIKRAYEHYMRLKKYSADNDAEEIQTEFEESFVDEDGQTFIDGDFEAPEEKIESQEQKSLKDYNIIFLKDSRVLFNIDIHVLVRANDLLLESPFDRITDQWINRSAVKAQNVSEEATGLFKKLKQQYIVSERAVGIFEETAKEDFASTLKHCEAIYRMIDSLGDNDLRRDVVKLDQSFSAGEISCCLYVGRILDTIIRDYIRYSGKSTAEERDAMTFERFRFELDAKCQFANIEYRFLKSENIFDDWKKKYVSRNGKERTSFKADMTDIVLKTNLVDLPAVYPTFLDELFGIYSSRNKAVHADREAQVDRDMIRKLEKALKVLFQLI